MDADRHRQRTHKESNRRDAEYAKGRIFAQSGDDDWAKGLAFRRVCFCFSSSPDKQKKQFSAASAVMRKNSKTIKIAKSASKKSNTYTCTFWRNGIFSHVLRLCGE